MQSGCTASPVQPCSRYAPRGLVGDQTSTWHVPSGSRKPITRLVGFDWIAARLLSAEPMDERRFDPDRRSTAVVSLVRRAIDSTKLAHGRRTILSCRRRLKGSQDKSIINISHCCPGSKYLYLMSSLVHKSLITFIIFY